MSDYVIGVVGNPNCGKTTLFNALTGTKQRVGNWPGVTVDRKSGEYTHQDKKIEVVDLPGFYSLSAASLDEEVARDYILSGEGDLIVNIIDASNLERNLYLTVLLLEMKVPIVVALNMMDMAKERRIEINVEELSERLGCPVVPMVASRGKGVNELKSVINHSAESKAVSEIRVMYPVEIQEAVDALVPEIRNSALDQKIDPLGLSVGDVSSMQTAAEEQEVSTGTFGAMVTLFDGRIGAFAYLLFILLYFPCVAAISAVYRETNVKWTVFVGAWTTGLAYFASILFYQTATIARHPVSSLVWIGVLSVIFVAVILIMRHIGNREQKSMPGVFDGAQA